MGFRIITHTAEEKKKAEADKEQEIKRIAEETLTLVDKAPNDLFPDFLWEPQVNEFESGNDYKIRATCTNPAVLKAYTLGRKYSNYWDYLEAIDTYYQYAKYINEAYGNFEMIRRIDNLEGIFIPPRPKLTHKKKNRLLMITGFIPSKIDPEYEADDEVILAAASTIKLHELDEDPYAKESKHARELKEATMKSKEKKDRISSIYMYGRSSEEKQGMDAIVSFLRSSSKKLDDDETCQSVSDLIEDLHEFDGMTEDEIHDLIESLEDTTIVSNGYLQKKSDHDRLELIKTLELNGFDFLNSSITGNMKTSAVRALRRELHADVDLSTLSKKKRKKMEKKLAKQKSDRRAEIASDRRLQGTLLKNRIHLSSDAATGFGVDADNINFHFADVFGRNYDE